MGVDIVQIDDPHLCLFVDPDVRRAYDNPDRAADFAVDMINALVAGFRGVRFAVHLCRRAGARVRGEKHHAGTYGPILPQLNRLKVQHLTMEFTAAGADDLESLGRLREDFELGLGVVDVTPGVEQTAEVIVERVRRPCSASTPSASRSTRTAASPPARRPRSASTRSSASCARRSRPRACCARAAK